MESMQSDIILYVAKLARYDNETIYMVLSKLSMLSITFNDRCKVIILRLISRKIIYSQMISLTPYLMLNKKKDGTYYLTKIHLNGYIHIYQDQQLLRLICNS